MNGTTLFVLVLVFAAGFVLGKFDSYLRKQQERESLLDELDAASRESRLPPLPPSSKTKMKEPPP